MSTLSIFAELDDVAAEEGVDCGLFFFQVDQVEHGLNRVGPLLVAADLDELGFELLENYESLVAGTGLQ